MSLISMINVIHNTFNGLEEYSQFSQNLQMDCYGSMEDILTQHFENSLFLS